MSIILKGLLSNLITKGFGIVKKLKKRISGVYHFFVTPKPRIEPFENKIRITGSKLIPFESKIKIIAKRGIIKILFALGLLGDEE